MPRLKAYLSHPYHYKDTEDKYIILEEMNYRRLEVIDPFEQEKSILEEFGVKDYWEGETYELARRIWTKDLQAISNSHVVVAWIPSLEELRKSENITYHTIGTAMEICYAYEKKKFIQIISPIHHPSFSVYADQYFESIDDFIRRREYRWARYKK